MNNVLELKGKFTQESKNTNNPPRAVMNGKGKVTSDQLAKLQSKISQIKEFWIKENKPFEGILISVYYNKIAAKSNRISGLFKGKQSNFSIVGAKFNKEKSKHIITYFLEIKDLDRSIDLLFKTRNVLSSYFENSINESTFKDEKKINKIPFKQFSTSKTAFKQVIADVS